MKPYSTKPHLFLFLLAAQIGGTTGCALVANGPGGVSKLSSSDSNSSPSLSAASAVKGDAIPIAEKKFAELFPTEIRYSAASLQGKASLCESHDTAKPMSVWLVDAREELTCFLMTERAGGANFNSFKGLRDAQDYGMLSKPHAVMGAKTLYVGIMKGTFWAFEDVGGVARLLEADCPKGADLDNGLVFRQLEQTCDFTTLKFDVLTKDAASAKAVKLDAEGAQFKARAFELAKARGGAAAKSDLEASLKVVFPKAVANDAKVVEAVKRFIAENQKKTDIDASKIKKMAQTEDWSATKSPIGLIMHRTTGVTVGFERSDEAGKDPAKKCAIASFEVKENYDGLAYEKPYATGLASAWTTIPCDRLK